MLDIKSLNFTFLQILSLKIFSIFLIKIFICFNRTNLIKAKITSTAPVSNSPRCVGRKPDSPKTMWRIELQIMNWLNEETWQQIKFEYRRCNYRGCLKWICWELTLPWGYGTRAMVSSTPLELWDTSHVKSK